MDVKPALSLGLNGRPKLFSSAEPKFASRRGAKGTPLRNPTLSDICEPRTLISRRLSSGRLSAMLAEGSGIAMWSSMKSGNSDAQARIGAEILAELQPCRAETYPVPETVPAWHRIPKTFSRHASWFGDLEKNRGGERGSVVLFKEAECRAVDLGFRKPWPVVCFTPLETHSSHAARFDQAAWGIEVALVFEERLPSKAKVQKMKGKTTEKGRESRQTLEGTAGNACGLGFRGPAQIWAGRARKDTMGILWIQSRALGQMKLLTWPLYLCKPVPGVPGIRRDSLLLILFASPLERLPRRFSRWPEHNPLQLQRAQRTDRPAALKRMLNKVLATVTGLH
ncbi:hypothetical protein BKA70DRAFT_1401213, partial [Coprinopsis sp. MPI-PUGE-AT-0042]